ncbi:MAG TPA: guanylate kinase [Bacteroidales bacterium]|nr:guanylate kinase [Bacteroidales bacterium]HNS47287.1 guanylate kinase [Bacteroidales bacterium]
MYSEGKGKVIIVSAPSGAGKTTIVRHLLAGGLNLVFSVSACSRPPRNHEINGKDYYFLSTAEFQQKIQEGDFVEWEEVYPGKYYGTLKREVRRIWDEDHHILFDVDVQGGINLKKAFGARALALFIMPPSLAELENRLRLRATDTGKSIRERVKKASLELTFAPKFDYTLINDDLEVAKKEAVKVVRCFLDEGSRVITTIRQQE